MEVSLLKRLIVGAPMSLAQARHERLSKTVASPPFRRGVVVFDGPFHLGS